LGEVHGAALAVGPQAEKVTDPVGEPKVEFPVTVAMSSAEEPNGTVFGLTAVTNDGVDIPDPPVTSTHSVEVLLSETAV
jgi:hypothetical protein